jgi:hypothetical protein
MDIYRLDNRNPFDHFGVQLKSFSWSSFSVKGPLYPVSRIQLSLPFVKGFLTFTVFFHMILMYEFL